MSTNLPHARPKNALGGFATEVAWDNAIAKARGIYGFDGIDPKSRSFNLIRAQILELKARRGWRLFGVVSATPKVGKSFIAANLAAALSRDPRQKTFALDLDLRRASLSAMFGVTPKVSLLSYLADVPGADAPSAYRFTNEYLTLFATKAEAIRSAELMAGPRAHSLMRAMRDHGDASIFIVDLPPVFANDDAITAMSGLDAYILVAEEGKTRQRELKDTIALLGAERLAGVILNKYRGGMVSEGYGFDDYYAENYSTDRT